MVYAKNRMGWMLAALLAAGALLTETVPTMRDTAIVRGVQLTLTTAQSTVTLLYHAVEPASDAADAKEQLAAATGTGETLARAYADAERHLPGRAVYQLCDTLLLTGEESLSHLDAVIQQTAQEEKGWLAARLLYAQQTPAPEEDTASALYEDLQRVSRYAPCLYQAAHPQVLVPVVNFKSAQPQQAVLVTAQQDCILLDGPEAQLYRALQKGYGRMILDGPDRQQVVDLVVSRRRKGNEVIQDVHAFVHGTLKKVPPKTAQEIAALRQKLEYQLRGLKCRTLQRDCSQ